MVLDMRLSFAGRWQGEARRASALESGAAPAARPGVCARGARAPSTTAPRGFALRNRSAARRAGLALALAGRTSQQGHSAPRMIAARMAADRASRWRKNEVIRSSPSPSSWSRPPRCPATPTRAASAAAAPPACSAACRRAPPPDAAGQAGRARGQPAATAGRRGRGGRRGAQALVAGPDRRPRRRPRHRRADEPPRPRRRVRQHPDAGAAGRRRAIFAIRFLMRRFGPTPPAAAPATHAVRRRRPAPQPAVASPGAVGAAAARRAGRRRRAAGRVGAAGRLRCRRLRTHRQDDLHPHAGRQRQPAT